MQVRQDLAEGPRGGGLAQPSSSARSSEGLWQGPFEDTTA